MSVAARFYLSGNEVHDRVIRAAYEGCPEKKKLVKDWKYEPSLTAVVFGIRKSRIPISFPRGEIIRQQRNNKLDVVILETGYINRGDGENHHYAVGLNGLNGRADFRNSNSPPDRAELLGICPRPFRTGRNVILCGQVPWDASVDHTDHICWLARTADMLAGLTERPVIFRPHPLADLPPFKGMGYSKAPLKEDLFDAHAVVTFNSNSAVEALLEGVPVFAEDEGSMVWNVCNRHLKDIDYPTKHYRAQWFNDLAYAQWTIPEIAEGKAWNHLFR